jgi:hypothetical protein
VLPPAGTAAAAGVDPIMAAAQAAAAAPLHAAVSDEAVGAAVT